MESGRAGVRGREPVGRARRCRRSAWWRSTRGSPRGGPRVCVHPSAAEASMSTETLERDVAEASVAATLCRLSAEGAYWRVVVETWRRGEEWLGLHPPSRCRPARPGVRAGRLRQGGGRPGRAGVAARAEPRGGGRLRPRDPGTPTADPPALAGLNQRLDGRRPRGRAGRGRNRAPPVFVSGVEAWPARKEAVSCRPGAGRCTGGCRCGSRSGFDSCSIRGDEGTSSTRGDAHSIRR